MKIYTNNYYNAGYQNNKKTVTRNNQPTFGFIAVANRAHSTHTPSYGYIISKLDIKNRTSEQLSDLAEYLHKLTNKELKEEVALRHTKVLGRRVQDEEAFNLIAEPIKKVKSQKLAAVERINILLPKIK